MTQENKELTQIKEISKTEGKGTKHGRNKNSDSLGALINKPMKRMSKKEMRRVFKIYTGRLIMYQKDKR